MKLLVFSLFLLYCIDVAVAASPPSVKIAAYKGNKAAAVCYTFDDGLRNQYLLAAPIMEKTGINGTFFIVAGKIAATKTDTIKHGKWEVMCWDEVKDLSNRGFEIGSHGITHRNLVENIKDINEIRREIEESAHMIREKIDVRPISICYPYNAFNEEIQRIADKTYAVDRTFQRGIGKHDVNADALNDWINFLINNRDRGVGMIHGLGDGFDPLLPEVLAEHLQYVKSREKDIWIDTFGNIGRYIKERDAAEIKVIEQTEKSITFCIHTGLEPELFNEPLTVIINDAIMVDCIPDGNPVTLRLK